MDPKRWKQIEDLFHQAAGLPARERRAFLVEASADDADLADAVWRLLDHRNEGGAFAQVIQRAARDLVHGQRLAPGTRLGVYAITGEIGEGGMGTVYRAERADGLFDQTVAIKLVHGGQVSHVRLERFAEERQILARLEHPHIARLLDGGATDDDVPYVVMEYVYGEPIDAYCERHDLDRRARLRLFLQICQAVQFAHQELIVHSDLKPANVLVTKSGAVRLLDFGIARLVSEADAGDAGNGGGKYDAGGERQPGASGGMTPWYSSPEQVRGDLVGTTSDVYTLGVLLHVLLAGRLPFDTDRAPGQSALVLSPGLDVDLRAIITRSLQTAQEDRYPSAARMAEDVERYLENFTVSARQGTMWYRAGKFIRRNPYATTLGALLVVAVIGFSVATLVQSRTVAAERDAANAARILAEEERNRAETVVEFLVGTLMSVSPENAQGREVTVRETLDRASAALTEKDSAIAALGAPAATLHRVIGVVYFRLGFLDEAEGHLERALAFRRGENPVNREQLYLILSSLAGVQQSRFRHDQALASYQEAARLSEAVNGASHRDTLGIRANIAGVYRGMGRLDEARAAEEDIYRRRLELLGPAHQDTIESVANLAVLGHWQGELAMARDGYRQCYEQARVTLGDNHPLTVYCLGTMGSVLEALGDYAQAERVLRKHIELSEEVLGEFHPERLRSLHNLADTLRGLEDYKASETLFLETLALRREHLGPTNVETLQTKYKLARLYGLMGRDEEATALASDAVRQLSDQLGSDHPTTLIARAILKEIETG